MRLVSIRSAGTMATCASAWLPPAVSVLGWAGVSTASSGSISGMLWRGASALGRIITFTTGMITASTRTMVMFIGESSVALTGTTPI